MSATPAPVNMLSRSQLELIAELYQRALERIWQLRLEEPTKEVDAAFLAAQLVIDGVVSGD